MAGASKLDVTLDLVRDISRETDPQLMIHKFRAHFSRLLPRDRMVSLSRRGLKAPWYRVTRCSDWEEDINPWTQEHRLPLLSQGLLGEVLYAGEPRVITPLSAARGAVDYEFLKDMQSLIALPLFDSGEAINMVVLLSRKREEFAPDRLADLLLTANLFGRATTNLVLAGQVQRAYSELDEEFRKIGALQRALLPARLPAIPGVGVASYYAAATRAGGDYFDFFELGSGRWGLFIADVSGHGASAAVIMAMTRTLLHAQCREEHTPAGVMDYLNQHLVAQADRYGNAFVTAFYGVFSADDRVLRYASAGHNPPIRVRTSGEVVELNSAQTFPLGLFPKPELQEADHRLHSGDTLLLYTDGITEAMNERGEMYGRDRLLACMSQPEFSAQAVIDCITSRLEGFVGSAPPMDDRTLVAMRMKE